MKDETQMYVISQGPLVQICYGVTTDIGVQARLAKHLNETDKPTEPYFVVPIRFKDLSQRGVGYFLPSIVRTGE
jgi:hypothetical protein